MVKQELEVTFKDLSFPLKIVVIFTWIFIVLFCLVFISGFMAGMLGA